MTTINEQEILRNLQEQNTWWSTGQIDKDLVLNKVDIREVYDVQSFGVTSKNTVGELHEVRYYDLHEAIPELNEKTDYNKEGK